MQQSETVCQQPVNNGIGGGRRKGSKHLVVEHKGSAIRIGAGALRVLCFQFVGTRYIFTPAYHGWDTARFFRSERPKVPLAGP